MSDKHRKAPCIKPLSAAIGAAFVTSLAFAPNAMAADDPFAMQELDSGYMVAGGEQHGEKGKEGKCGEGKCGGDKEGKEKEGKCGEGKCGGDKEEKGEEGKCGEGKCGGDKEEEKGEEGKCGGQA